jgi:hypothetical protein
MKKTANIAIENKDEAAGFCLACERSGLPVFLLRQAVIKTKFNKIKQVNQTYQELANYTKTLDFKQRMPDEALKYYDYVLRTLRNGYVYVMQQQGDDIESRILHSYECIDGALRLKNFHELTNTQPRPISKACTGACHTIPASFIHLRLDYTQAWVAYASQPWPKKTIDDYLKEKNSNVLSRLPKLIYKNSKTHRLKQRANERFRLRIFLVIVINVIIMIKVKCSSFVLVSKVWRISNQHIPLPA